MGAKRAARRRAAKIQDTASRQELSPEHEAGVSTVALLLAMSADRSRRRLCRLARPVCHLSRPGRGRGPWSFVDVLPA